MKPLLTFRFAVVCFAVISGTASAQPFERILVPVVAETPVPGAFGSQWVTEITGQNVGRSSVRLFFPVCPNFECVYAEIPPGAVFGSSMMPTSLSPHGTVLTLWPDQAASVIVSARVRDLSRGLQTWGTEIPVVREGDLTWTPLSLLNVPHSDRFRLTLRMYDFGVVDNAFTVVVLPLEGETPLAEILLPAALLVDANGANQGIRYAVLSDLQLPANAPDRLRIIVRTMNPTSFWAFAAVTNNETQHVTVITPGRVRLPKPPPLP